MQRLQAAIFGLFLIGFVSACGGGGSTYGAPRPVVTPMPTATPAPTPTPVPTAQPQVIRISFELHETTDPTYGPVWFYGPQGATNAQVVRVKSGSKLVFAHDGNDPPHTASGLGSSGFPSAFDNSSGTTQSGSTIDGSTTWSTGSLVGSVNSQVFTVGPPGAYYFGCAYHYAGVPTSTNMSMGDVLVST
jgi:plastocyanin